MASRAATRKSLEERLSQIERRIEKIDRSRRRETNALSENWTEQVNVRQNDEILDGLNEEELAQAEAIREALCRMDEGTYGICSDCEGKIAPARLRALPHASLCISCAEKREASLA